MALAESISSEGRAVEVGADQGEVVELRSRCSVYTKPEVVCRILDAVGWREDVDLSKARMLEPAAGNGVFLLEAARRLVGSLRIRGVPLRAAMIKDRIAAFEICDTEAERARRRLVVALRDLGLHQRTADSCSRSWVLSADFLLSDLMPESFTHVVGNPPYVRWAKIPPLMRSRYEDSLPRTITRGDLFIPFLDRSLESLSAGGRCGFLCTDRWRFMVFGQEFRKRWLPLLDIKEEASLTPREAYQTAVSTYPTMLIASKRAAPAAVPESRSSCSRTKTLADLGCRIRVGPALGYAKAFVLSEDDDEEEVEAELLFRWIKASDIAEGEITWSGKRIIAMNADDGSLRNLEEYPLLRKRLKAREAELRTRAIVENGATWFRTIDRVRACDWAAPKLLVPEIAKVPRLAIDSTGAIPSHGVYAIFRPDGEIEEVYELLKNGKLAAALDGLAPRVNGGYFRCYKRILSRIRI